MKTEYKTDSLPSAWDNVEDYIDDARLIAFDGCHKIYLALDDIEAAWFSTNYDHVLRDTPKVMMAQLRKWYDESCPLKFIQGVRHDADDPNAGFISLIDQGARDEAERCEECEYFDCDGECTSSDEKDTDDE